MESFLDLMRCDKFLNPEPSLVVGAHFSTYNKSDFGKIIDQLNNWFIFICRFTKPIRSLKDNDKMIVLQPNRKGAIFNEDCEDIEYDYKERSKKFPKHTTTLIEYNYYKRQYSAHSEAKWKKKPHYTDDFPFLCRKVNTKQYIKYVSNNYKIQDNVSDKQHLRKNMDIDFDNIE